MSDHKKIKYEQQFYPGTEKVSERRRKIMDPERRLVKLREIPDDDVVQLLGHRAPGSLYTS
ncbi:MAG: coenzyme-B sulfoethylthiotransferase subunit gamma, partial [Candidatus Helarchaeota archaeon]